MIYLLEGTLVHAQPGLAVILCGGVGYAARVTLNTMSALPSVGQEVRLYTSLQVREDAVELYGFADLQEKDCFLRLLTVSGVGPAMALAVLSDLTPDQFLLSIASGDSKRLTRVKGVGAKKAQRIILELKDKIDTDQMYPSSGGTGFDGQPSHLGEAAEALVLLGYTQSDAARALAGLSEEESVSELIKTALRRLSGN